MQPKKHEQVLSQSSEKMNDKQKEMDPSAQARQIVDEDKKNIPGLEITVDIIRIDDTPVDIRPPEGRNIKYYLWALAFFLFIFILSISYSFYYTKATSFISITVPRGTELYYKNELLQHIKKQSGDIILYSARLRHGKHTLTAIDSDKKTYTLQFEIKENDTQPRSYIFYDGTFHRF